MSANMTTVRNGYVAMLDILGWKGIWRRHDLDRILDVAKRVRRTLQSVERETRSTFAPSGYFAQFANNLPPWARGPSEEHTDEVNDQLHLASQTQAVEVESLFLSDTVVIGLSMPEARLRYEELFSEPEYKRDSLRLGWLTKLVCRTLQDCALGEVPVVFRGAIAKGTFVFDENLLVGEAVDRAASAMNVGNAAMVWSAPLEQRNLVIQRLGQQLSYEMPLRDGTTRTVSSVNPFWDLHSEEEINAVYHGFMNAFGRELSPTVQTKMARTKEFLDAARAQWEVVRNGIWIDEGRGGRQP